MTCRIWAIQGTWVGVSTWSGQRDRGETMEPVAPEECQVGSPAHSKIQGLPYQVRCPWRIRSQFQYSRIYEHLFRFDCWSSSIFIDLHRSSSIFCSSTAGRCPENLLSFAQQVKPPQPKLEAYQHHGLKSFAICRMSFPSRTTRTHHDTPQHIPSHTNSSQTPRHAARKCATCGCFQHEQGFDCGCGRPLIFERFQLQQGGVVGKWLQVHFFKWLQVCSQEVVRTIKTDLGRPLEETFRDFGQRPIASASVGQDWANN